MNAPKTDWLALGAAICHNPRELVQEETRLAEREERERFDENEPPPAKFTDDRREELNYWRRS